MNTRLTPREIADALETLALESEGITTDLELRQLRDAGALVRRLGVWSLQSRVNDLRKVAVKSGRTKA